MTELTLNELTTAIRNSIESGRIGEDEAKSLAEHVLNFFGYNNRIIDNILQPEDRDVFYMMEDSGILTTEREETTLYDGREWRIHYWIFQKENIDRLISIESDEPDAALTDCVYQEIFQNAKVMDDIWGRKDDEEEEEE